MSRTAWFNPDDLYPQELTSCSKEPAVPARPAPGEPRSDEDKANYTKDLRSAWADCHDTVDATADRKDRYKKQFDDANKKGIFGRLFGG